MCDCVLIVSDYNSIEMLKSVNTNQIHCKNKSGPEGGRFLIMVYV